MQQRSFVHGALLLAAAAAVSKLLGSVYTIVLQNVIGDHGMGLFQMAYPVYATLLAVATAGFPVAISKLVSERLAFGDEAGARAAFQTSLGVLAAAGVICFALLFFGAPWLAVAAGDPAAAPAIRAIAPALLLVPVMSALRGFYQGYQWMVPTAVSQVVEQLVRVITILVLSTWLMAIGAGEAWAAAGAAFGAVTGAVAGLAVLIWYAPRRPRVRAAAAGPRLSATAAARRLIYLAFPISLGALVVPLMNNIDVVTVVNLLKHTGEDQAMATAQFGLLTGRAFKLMMLPTTLAAGIGIAVMPAVSESFTLGFRQQMSGRIDTAVRLTILLALPAAAGLAVLANPLDIALFRDVQGADVIQVMAWATVFASAQTTAAAILQGAGFAYLPVLNLVLAGVVKLLLNLWWVPMWGIEGAALSTVVSYGVAAILNFRAMARRMGEPWRWKRWLFAPAAVTFIMTGVVYAMERQWELWGGLAWGRAAAALACVVMAFVGACVYGMALLVSGMLSKRELIAIPKIGPRLVHWCSRWGFLR